jgi:hypothetical protein
MHAARSRRATRVSWIRTDLARGLFVMREAISMQLEVHSWIRTDRARGRGMTILHVLDKSWTARGDPTSKKQDSSSDAFA